MSPGLHDSHGISDHRDATRSTLLCLASLAPQSSEAKLKMDWPKQIVFKQNKSSYHIMWSTLGWSVARKIARKTRNGPAGQKSQKNGCKLAFCSTVILQTNTNTHAVMFQKIFHS